VKFSKPCLAYLGTIPLLYPLLSSLLYSRNGDSHQYLNLLNSDSSEVANSFEFSWHILATIYNIGLPLAEFICILSLMSGITLVNFSILVCRRVWPAFAFLILCNILGYPPLYSTFLSTWRALCPMAISSFFLLYAQYRTKNFTQFQAVSIRESLRYMRRAGLTYYLALILFISFLACNHLLVVIYSSAIIFGREVIGLPRRIYSCIFSTLSRLRISPVVLYLAALFIFIICLLIVCYVAQVPNMSYLSSRFYHYVLDKDSDVPLYNTILLPLYYLAISFFLFWQRFPYYYIISALFCLQIIFMPLSIAITYRIATYFFFALSICLFASLSLRFKNSPFNH
jgi:hypothetical protein